MNKKKKYVVWVFRRDKGESSDHLDTVLRNDPFQKEYRSKKGPVARMVFFRRNQTIQFFNQNNQNFYEIDMEGVKKEKMKDWFFHMAGKLWMRENPQMLYNLQRLLSDIEGFYNNSDK